MVGAGLKTAQRAQIKAPTTSAKSSKSAVPKIRFSNFMRKRYVKKRKKNTTQKGWRLGSEN